LTEEVSFSECEPVLGIHAFEVVDPFDKAVRTFSFKLHQVPLELHLFLVVLRSFKKTKLSHEELSIFACGNFLFDKLATDNKCVFLVAIFFALDLHKTLLDENGKVNNQFVSWTLWLEAFKHNHCAEKLDCVVYYVVALLAFRCWASSSAQRQEWNATNGLRVFVSAEL
jgi:hypothetical protein